MKTRTGSIELISLCVVVVLIIIALLCSSTVISPGHVGVQVTMGTVNEAPLREGMHFVNPFSHIEVFDIRQQTHKEEDVMVPSRDQLTSKLDVSIQYTVKPELAPKILKEIGDLDRVQVIVMQPKIRSALREATKTVQNAEEYMSNETQTRLQTLIESELATLEPMGIHISAVLLRDITLPDVIQTAVKTKKVREQAVIQQQADLQRFTVEQQQKVAQAEAEKKASEMAALRTRIEADAEAYKIKALNDAAAQSPVYVQLKALDALVELSKNPAHKIFFIDGKGQYPVPLLHMNDAENLKVK